VRLSSGVLIIAPVVLALLASTGLTSAQSTTTGSSNPSVNASNTASSSHLVAETALEKGSNSFTEGEARSRLESAGLSNVTDLKKDNSGIWRGKAMRKGASVSVGLDYKGSIAAE